MPAVQLNVVHRNLPAFRAHDRNFLSVLLTIFVHTSSIDFAGILMDVFCRICISLHTTRCFKSVVAIVRLLLMILILIVLIIRSIRLTLEIFLLCGNVLQELFKHSRIDIIMAMLSQQTHHLVIIQLMILVEVSFILLIAIVLNLDILSLRKILVILRIKLLIHMINFSKFLLCFHFLRHSILMMCS